MCGRFVTKSEIFVIKKLFDIKEVRSGLSPSYNIAPSQDVAVVVKEGVNKLIRSRWGFIPSWSKDESVGYKLINARAETVAAKPMFKGAFEKHRCLIVADGFYEWKKTGREKTPFYITLGSGEPFGFAGLYNIWTSPEGRHIWTCTIITTDANGLIKPIHNRMPVIVPRDKQDLWLTNDADKTELFSILKRYPSRELTVHEVSRKVNSPRHDLPENILPISRSGSQTISPWKTEK